MPLLLFSFNNRKKNSGIFSLTFLLPFVMGKWVYKLQIPEMYLNIAEHVLVRKLHMYQVSSICKMSSAVSCDLES